MTRDSLVAEGMRKEWKRQGPAPDRFSEEQLQVYVRQVLCDQLFAGDYRERIYVPQLTSYRDVVELWAREENLRNILEDVRQRLQRHYELGNVMFGISRTENECRQRDAGTQDKLRLYVSLKNMAFGRYWFLIKSVKFTGTEVVLHLKCLRPVADTEGSLEDEEQRVPGQVVNWDQLKEDWKQTLSRGVETALAVDNVRQAAVFLLVMMVSLATGAFHAVRHLGDFSLKLLHEVSGLVRALTPLMLGIVDFLSKCVGGLYLLVVMMFGGRGLPPQPQPPARGMLPSIKYGRHTADDW